MRMQFLKSLLCLVLAFAIVLPISGCGNKQPTNIGGKYVDADGHIIEKKEVTLDVIAQSEYKKNFDNLKKGKDRKKVISLYLEYHIPASSEDEIARKKVIIEQISKLDVSSSNMVDLLNNGVSVTEGVISDASNALALANIYSKIKNDAGFEGFIEKIDKSCSVADVVTKFTKACLIAADLSNNDISNKEEYCADVIDALSYITSYVPIFDNYFEKTLDVVKVGVQTVVKKYNRRYGNLSVYLAECDQSGFFSVENKHFEFILDSSKWDSEIAPSIADILQYSNQLDTIPAGEPFECLKEYIIYRISFEQQNLQSASPNASTPPDISKIKTWYGEGKSEHSRDRRFHISISKVSEDYISGHLSVYSINSKGEIKYTHQTDFEGQGTLTDGGIIYTLKFAKSVTFGVIPAVTCEEMEIFYHSKEDTFEFEGMYDVIMSKIGI